MKKFLLSFFALLSIVISAQAQTYFEVGGLRYRVWQDPWEENPGQVYVAKSSDEMAEYSGDIVIPPTVTYTKTYNVIGIESQAFKDCSGITSVIIGDNVTDIQDRAFSGCDKLASLTIGTGVTNISWEVFKGCESLTTVTIPNSVTNMSNSVFSGCSKLSSVTLSDKLETIEWGTFQNCTSLKSISIPDKVTSIGGSAFSGCSELAEVILGSKLKTIENSAFYNCTTLKSITIPEGVTTIGGSAFNGCTSLSSITIPSTVTRIGGDDTWDGSTFSNCSSLTSITIPGKVKIIKGNTFSNCTSLTSITIPDGVTEIGESAFNGCTSLASITIPNSVKKIGGSAFSQCTSLTSITIPELVTKIEGSTFSNCTSLTSITIPQSVTEIGGSAFWNCTSLTSITIPDGVIKIEGSTFSECKSLSSITIPNSVTEIGGSAFSQCTSLTSITIPDGVTKIEGSTFSGCSKLTSVTLGNQLTAIGEYAFNSCSSLTAITIPGSVTKIERWAFMGCNNLKQVTSKIETPFELENVFDWSIQYAALVVPKDTRTVYKNTEGWKNFAVIFEEGEANYTIERTEEGVKYSLRLAEDNSVYYAVTGYTEALKPETVILSVLEDCPVKAIAENSFSNCSILASITIPNSVTSIGQGAFYSCSNLKMVKSEIVTPFKVSAFDWYNNNNKVILVVPQGSRAAYKDQSGWGAYYIYEEGEPIYDVADTKTDEQGLKYELRQSDDFGPYYAVIGRTEDMKADIVIPADIDGCPVWGIEWSAFNECKTLKSITFKNDIKIIRDNILYGCSNLEEVNVYVWDDAEFCNNHILGGLQNPLGFSDNGNYVEKYYTINLFDNEGNEITDFVVPEGVTTIGDGAFKGYEGLYSITIPKSVTSIGVNAFRNCKNLATVKIGKNNSITSIGDYAFSGCTSLNSITLPKKLESIGSGAFSGDWSKSDYMYHGCPITSIAIPCSVKTIGNEAFRYCRDLVLVSFEVNEDGSASLNSIGNNAFRECSFASISVPNSVTTIGTGAFADNNKLTSAILSDAVTEIQNETFQYCGNLASISIPDGVTNIGEYAFRGCGFLTSVKIPNSLASMGEQAFEGCSLKSIELPDAFTTIPDNLFKNNNLGYIKLGNNVKKIGKNAFGSTIEGNDGTIVIEIGTSTPPTIAKDAFPNLADMLGVINVIVPDEESQTAYGKASVWKDMTFANMKTNVELTVDQQGNIGRELYDDCKVMPAKVVGLKVKGSINADDFQQMRSNFKSLLRLDLSECDITEIPDGAMYGKTQLQELTLPTSLQTIGNKAFMDCPYLTGKLDLPSGVTSIGNSAFEGTNYTSVTLPNKLKTIGNKAFYNLPIKQKLTLPDALTSIGDYAFAETQVSGYVEMPNGMTYLGNGAFRNTQIESTALPDDPKGITSISWGLFQGCTNFKPYPLYIPGTYTRVEAYAFDGCSNLSYVRMSPNLESIGEYAFQNTQVEYLKVPSKVENLPTGVFKNCKSLESLSLPANLKQVGPEALYGCSALRNLSVEATTPPTAERNSLLGVNTDLCLISIPTTSFYDYLMADYWGQFVQMRNDIAVETEGNGEIAFESVVEGEEEEALSRTRGIIAAARAKTRAAGNDEDDDMQMTFANNGSSILIPKGGKIRFVIIPAEAETLVSATLDGEDITSLIDEDGIYTTTADKESAKLVVKFSGSAQTDVETSPITIGKTGKASYCGDKSLDFSFSDEIKAYIATGFDETEGTIWLTRVKDVPAGTPVMIKGVAEKTYDVPVTNSQNSYYKNMFKGNTSGDKIQIAETDGSLVNYYLSGDGTFKKVKGYANIGNNKSYLQLPGTFNPTSVGGNQTVTIKAVGKASYAAPVDLDFTNVQGLKAFTATGYDKSTKTIWLTRVMKVQKGEGVMLKGNEGEYQIPSVAVQSSYQNMFIGNTSGDKIQVKATSDDGSLTNFYLKGDGTFVSVNGYVNLGNNKCYLALPTFMLDAASTRGAEPRYLLDEPEVIKVPISSMSLDDDGEGTTGIRETMQSGEDGAYYTLQGQRVEKPGKGVYIRNGKKVIIR